MTSSKRSKLPCATCGKAIGIFTCRRCKKDFCSRHSIEHRQTLGKQMDEIIVDHDQLQQNLVDGTKEPRRYPIIKQMDD
ncbi:unnamed protein product [Rotaria sordida]|uniref:AN1-type domain-containing protein n=1 Tax=Rotaria sordida TaxID=392033 RepID=A0A814XUU1_9BILA|nr:unnamed protein product [Rotaria sordida]CAF1219969.1 unnamed protein product [Rotaria sordida]CAF1220716.1 unnamed protein product [Rotaria sordida]